MASEQTNVNALKRGMVLELPEGLLQVLEAAHHKPGKGNAVVRTKLRRLSDSAVLDKTFNSDTKVMMVRLEQRSMQYLYPDGVAYVFMDTSSYEQVTLSAEQIGDENLKFLKDGTVVEVAFNGTDPVTIDLPTSVEVVVTETDPGVRGDRSSAGTKPAVVDTGATVNVPLFVNIGDAIKVDTRTGEYQTRVQK